MDVQIATCLKGPRETDSTLAEVGSNLVLMDSMAYEADRVSGSHEAKSELHVGLLAEDYLRTLSTSSNQSPAFLSDPIEVTETPLPSPPLSGEMDGQLATCPGDSSSALAEPTLSDLAEPIEVPKISVPSPPCIEKSEDFSSPERPTECTEEDEIEERKRQIDILFPQCKYEVQNFSNSRYPAIPGLVEHFLTNLTPSPAFWRSDAPHFKIKPEATISKSQSDKNTCTSQQMATRISVHITNSKPVNREKHFEKTSQDKQLLNPERESILTRHAEALSKVMVNNMEGFLKEDLRDYHHQMSRTDRIFAENFNLKLDLLHTKERLYKQHPGDLDKVLKEIIQCRIKAQETLRETLRLRAMVEEANEYIAKITHTKKARKKSKEEEDMHRHLQESNKCCKHFKVLNDKIACQDREIKHLKNALSQYHTRMPSVEPAASNPTILTANSLSLRIS
ncbi:hypothetical protein L0F63_000411, partial [Massospora cicadina]